MLMKPKGSVKHYQTLFSQVGSEYKINTAVPLMKQLKVHWFDYGTLYLCIIVTLAFIVSLLINADSCNCGALDLSSLPCDDENNLMKYVHEVDCNLIVKCNIRWRVNGWSIM